MHTWFVIASMKNRYIVPDLRISTPIILEELCWTQHKCCNQKPRGLRPGQTVRRFFPERRRIANSFVQFVCTSRPHHAQRIDSERSFAQGFSRLHRIPDSVWLVTNASCWHKALRFAFVVSKLLALPHTYVRAKNLSSRVAETSRFRRTLICRSSFRLKEYSLVYALVYKNPRVSPRTHSAIYLQ
jgi:hypothetical protein